jgi:hypothetical protein
MEKLKAESEESYNNQFSKWDANLKTAKVESVEDLMVKVHEGIRSDPKYTKVVHTKKKTNFASNAKDIVKTAKGNYKRDRKISYETRKKNVAMKLKIARGE